MKATSAVQTIESYEQIPIIHHYEMSLDHREFLRILPGAIHGLPFDQSDSDILIHDGEHRQVHISLSVESVRRIALLALPVTHVTITLNGYTAEDAAAFMDYFNARYQRGGG